MGPEDIDHLDKDALLNLLWQVAAHYYRKARENPREGEVDARIEVADWHHDLAMKLEEGSIDLKEAKHQIHGLLALCIQMGGFHVTPGEA